jgi:hypothetical protein
VLHEYRDTYMGFAQWHCFVACSLNRRKLKFVIQALATTWKLSMHLACFGVSPLTPVSHGYRNARSVLFFSAYWSLFSWTISFRMKCICSLTLVNVCFPRLHTLFLCRQVVYSQPIHYYVFQVQSEPLL